MVVGLCEWLENTSVGMQSKGGTTRNKGANREEVDVLGCEVKEVQPGTKRLIEKKWRWSEKRRVIRGRVLDCWIRGRVWGAKLVLICFSC